MQVWAVATTGGAAPKLLGDGDAPVISPDSTRVAFTRDRKIFVAPIDGTKQGRSRCSRCEGPASRRRGRPTARRSRSSSNRGDHSFIGLFTPGQPIRYINPKTTRDEDPVWSIGRTKIAFVRQPGAGGAPRSARRAASQSWSIMVADVSATPGRRPIARSSTSGDPIDPIARNPVGLNVRWAADDTLVYFSYRDGWQHLYAIHASGQRQQAASADARRLHGRAGRAYAGSRDHRLQRERRRTAEPAGDIDRRHLFKVPIDGRDADGRSRRGAGIEWNPVVTGDGQDGRVHLRRREAAADSRGRADRRRQRRRLIAADHIPQDFPTDKLIVPQPVVVPRERRRRSPRAAVPRGRIGARAVRRSSTSTAAARARCCSAGTIGGNTRTTTRSTSTSPAAASSCSR